MTPLDQRFNNGPLPGFWTTRSLQQTTSMIDIIILYFICPFLSTIIRLDLTLDRASAGQAVRLPRRGWHPIPVVTGGTSLSKKLSPVSSDHTSRQRRHGHWFQHGYFASSLSNWRREFRSAAWLYSADERKITTGCCLRIS